MITVDDIVADHDMAAPELWTIERSTGIWTAGGFQSITTPIQVSGPVRVASDKEIMMIPEGDRIGSVRNFYTTQVMYVTRGHAPVQIAQTTEIQGTGQNFVLPAVPAGGAIQLIYNGKLLTPFVDYTLYNNVIKLTTIVVMPNDFFAYSYFTVQYMSVSASDVIVFNGSTYRVLAVYHTPGSAYWKATATRMSAS